MNELNDPFRHGKELFWSRIDLLNDRKDFLWEEWIDSVTEMILLGTRSVLRRTKWIHSVTQGIDWARKLTFFEKKRSFP